jgi:DNA-binding beta-propeller fold protein YncE
MATKKYTYRHLAIFAAITLSTVCVSNSRADGPYHFLGEIPVGGEGGWDYLSIDPAARRLYATHATKIVVIDIDKQQVVGEIADTPGVHGFALAPELQRGFSSNGREAKSSIVDLASLKTLSKVDTGENPDAIVYDAGRQEVYTFNGHGESATVFSAKTGNVITNIALPGKPEFAATDSKSGRVYNNLEDKSQVVVIDSETHQIVNTWPIAPGEEASGMAIDTEHHRLFVGCHNKLMVMMDSTSGKVVATVPIGDRVDANAFDPGTQFAFSSNGDGTVTIAHEDAPDKLVVVQQLTTERGARTMALDTQTHRIYLASAKYEPQPAPQPGETRQRPKIIPGSFKILVYGMENTPAH